MGSKPAPQSSFVLLWRGESPAFREALLELLDASNIPYWEEPLGEPETSAIDPLPLDWRPRFGFEVSVPSAQFSIAKQLLERLLDEEPLDDVELPAEDEAEAAPQSQAVSQADEPATVGVWTGNDPRTVEFLTAALRENEIPIRVEESGGESSIYVPPSNEARAREVVREVTEGAPPE